MKIWSSLKLAVLVLCAASAVAVAEERAVAVISDLHLGVGQSCRGSQCAWDNYEDFRWAADFAAFLDAIDGDGRSSVDLILNGDTFELWQSHDGACVELADKNLGCTEQEALSRMRQAIAQHGPELDALVRFARRGANRVWLVPGNHDAVLLFPGVAQLLSGRFAEPRIQLLPQGYWMSADGKIVAEHGHLIGKDANRFDSWPHPFISARGQSHLQRSWGEQFVVRFYNPWEDKYPIIDNISEEFAGAKLAMAVEGRQATARAMAGFLHFFFRDVSWHQFGQGLGDSKGAPKWNLSRLRQSGGKGLQELLPPGDPLRAAMADPELAAQVLRDLDDNDLIALCDRELIRRRSSRLPGQEVVNPCPVDGLGDGGGLGAITESLFRKRNSVLAGRMQELFKQLTKSRPGADRFDMYIYSHTHRAEAPFQPITSGAWRPWVANSGAWQRVITPQQIEGLKSQPADILKLRPEDLPACYGYVWIPPKAATPQTRSFRQERGSWTRGEGLCAQLPFARRIP